MPKLSPRCECRAGSSDAGLDVGFFLILHLGIGIDVFRQGLRLNDNAEVSVHLLVSVIEHQVFPGNKEN